MRILVTNDDGIYAEGLYALVSEIKKIGTVTVVAPDSERSSVGHGITLAHPIWYKKVVRKGRFFGYGISGTPADCVKFAIKILLKDKPDLIISGINLGSNDGCSVFYSGTVAGAREGALNGIPSLAVSLDTFVRPDYKLAAKIARLVSKMISQEGLPQGTFLNINVPNQPLRHIRGIKLAQQCTRPIEGIFQKRQDPQLRTYYWMSGKAPRTKGSQNNDTKALKEKYVTISPVHCDLTDYHFLQEMKNWNVDGISKRLLKKS